jgi:hypothetical protein
VVVVEVEVGGILLLLLVVLELLYKVVLVEVQQLHLRMLILVVEVVVRQWVLPQTDKEVLEQVQRLLVRHYFTLVEEVVVLLLELILEQILYLLVEAVLVETEGIKVVQLSPLLLEQTAEVVEEEGEEIGLLLLVRSVEAV